jgi:glycosyltransferase involved in cell wall biosynthesis
MQRHSQLLVEALARTGEVDLVVLHPHPGEKIFPDFPNVEEVALPPLPGKKHYFFELRDYSKLVLEEAKKRPDHLIYSQGLSIWAGLDQVKARLVVNPHGLEPFQALGWTAWLKTWPYRMVFRRLFRKAAHTISLGGRLTTILEKVMGRSADRIVVLPNATNPVDPPREQLLKTKGKPVKFVFAGRFAHNKGIDLLLEAAKRLNESGRQKDFELDLAGKGPLFEEMQRWYKLPNVRFGGFVPDEDLERMYLEGDFFVLPTLFEGMPTVVLEAMARAMPAIVSDVGATRELTEGGCGILIEKNNLEDLLGAMTDVLDMEAGEFARYSERALDRFLEKYTWEAVARRHLEMFGKLSRTS